MSVDELTETERAKQAPGCTGGFHFGTLESPCNGVYHATDRNTEDGRQIFVCDACGSEGVRRREQPK
jgi:hypothetical protein